VVVSFHGFPAMNVSPSELHVPSCNYLQFPLFHVICQTFTLVFAELISERSNLKTAGFMESLWRDIDMNRLHHAPADDLNLIIVTHGLTSRVFLMKWFKWTVEQFENLNNPRNCEYRVMELGVGGEYSLAIHHSEEQMVQWGLSPEMISDQKWRAHATRGEWNENCPWYFDAFFDQLADSDDGVEDGCNRALEDGWSCSTEDGHNNCIGVGEAGNNDLEGSSSNGVVDIPNCAEDDSETDPLIPQQWYGTK